MYGRPPSNRCGELPAALPLHGYLGMQGQSPSCRAWHDGDCTWQASRRWKHRHLLRQPGSLRLEGLRPDALALMQEHVQFHFDVLIKSAIILITLKS